MLKIIGAKPDSNGKVTVKLYGKVIDVTDIIFNGVAELHVFGDDYEIHVSNPNRKKLVKQTNHKPVTDSEIAFNDDQESDKDNKES